ncbi:DedA family protein [Bacillus badius]|uniref:Alkaline phosphatase n=1 Tax=Bacillus badius TaxID=1455 RepID=A0ABR5AXG5_BACBA|nr:DedA family protein [Bacillus badius]KIL76131.1 Alkaline phosphatase [Bacillus badius]KIL79305.1 Alkaline phosphatase [Bacillus badius]MED4716491.1 DedA family protein [Bacillus badius]
MQSWMIEMMEQFGYIGIFLLIAIENIFPPIPSEVILTFGGTMTTFSTLTVPGVVLAATGGSITGAVILYKAGNLLDVGRLEKVIDRWGHVLHLNKKDIYKADHWFNDYGYWTVLVCRVIPFLRSLISIPAGMARMRFSLFLLFTTIGTFVWNLLLVYAGALFGESWEQIVLFVDMYAAIIYALVGAGLTILLFLLAVKRK